MNICFIFPQIHNHNNERHLRNIFNIENYNIDYLFTESHNKPSHQQKVLNLYVSLAQLQVQMSHLQGTFEVFPTCDVL